MMHFLLTIFFLGSTAVAIVAPSVSHAIVAENPAVTPQPRTSGGVTITFGGSPAGPGGVPAVTGGQSQAYLQSLYKWFLGFVGVAALFAFVMGGVLYMFAGANITTTAQARKWITNGVLGLLIAAASYLLLRAINPELVGGFDIETLIRENLPKRSTPSGGLTQPSGPEGAPF